MLDPNIPPGNLKLWLRFQRKIVSGKFNKTFRPCFAASIHSLATPIGSLASVPIMDGYGRKNTLLLSVAPLIAGWSSIALAESHSMILTGRIICGIAVGLMSAPAQVRGF